MKIFIAFLFSLIGRAVFAQPAPNPAEKVGEVVTLSGRVYSANYLVHVKTKPTFLNVYDSSPSHRLMLRIDSIDRAKFSSPPESYFLNRNVTVRGRVENYKGTPLIRITDPSMMEIDKQERDTVWQKSPVVNNKYVSNAPIYQAGPQSALRSDTALQSKWVSDVSKQNQEMEFTDIRMVMKEIPLRVNPSNDAPLVANLQPGISVSILSTSKKWSYVAIKKPNGSGAIYGFIKKRMHKYLKEVKK